MDKKQITIQVAQLDPVKPTQKGEPQRGVKATEGRWLKVRGAKIGEAQVGDTLTITEPSEYNRKWYSQLIGIKPAQQAKQNSIGPVDLDEYLWLLKKAHEIVKELEPDDGNARARMVNTLMMAFSNGKIDISLDSEEPAERDYVSREQRESEDIPPWER